MADAASAASTLTTVPAAAGGQPPAAADAPGQNGPVQNKQEYLLQRLTRAAGNLVELRIVTAYGQVNIRDFEKVVGGEETPAFTNADQTNAFTSINMLTGDIVTAMHPSFTAAENVRLLDFHNKQVELGRQIVADNIKALSDVIDKIWNKLR